MTTVLDRLVENLSASEVHEGREVPTRTCLFFHFLALEWVQKGTGRESRSSAPVLGQESWMMSFDVCGSGIWFSESGATGRTFGLGPDVRG